MTDPIVATGGNTYERAALLQHLHVPVLPVTGDMLENTDCVTILM